MGLVALALLVTIPACSPPPEPEQEVRQRSSRHEPLKAPLVNTTGARQWETRFISTARPASGNQVGRLQFDVCLVGETVGEMELIDAANPTGTTLDAGFCTVQITPQVNKPKVTSKRDRQCTVAGYYDLVLSDAGGRPVGQFRITEIGMLEFKSESVRPEFDVELLTAVERTLFAVYPHRTAGFDPPPLLALEFLHNECKTSRSLAAGDGWDYTFQFADGLLRALPPACLEGWPEYLRTKGAEELAMRRQVNVENGKRLEGEDPSGG